MIHVELEEIKRAFKKHQSAWEKLRDDVPGTDKMVLFYAVECGLKTYFMNENKLPHTGAKVNSEKSAAEFQHDINGLLAAVNMDYLKISRQGIRNKEKKNRDIKSQVDAKFLHQAWRYGYELDEECETRWVDELKKILEELNERLRGSYEQTNHQI